MTLEQFKSLFPLKGEITQKILDEADVWSNYNCIGALTLKASLGQMENLFPLGIRWSNRMGIQMFGTSKIPIKITTLEDLPLMKITKPRSVTFIVQDVPRNTSHKKPKLKTILQKENKWH